MTQVDIETYKVEMEVVIDREDVDELVADYGDEDELEDDPTGATEEAITNFFDVLEVGFIRVSGKIKVKRVEV